MTSLDPNGTIVLKPNPYFYGHPGHIKRILLIKYQDDDAALRDLELGQVDAINTGKTTWAVQLRKEVNAKMWASPAPGFDEIAMNSCPIQGSPTCTGPGKNVNVKVVQDQAIRQALNWAIDRGALARIVYNGLYTPGTGIISSYYKSRGYFTSYADDPEIGYTYDPEKAHQVLEQGGWKCPAVGSQRDLYQGRHEGRVHARPALVGLPAAAGRPARQGVGGRRSGSRSTSTPSPRTRSTPRSTTRPAPRRPPTPTSTSPRSTRSSGGGSAT